MHVCVLIFACMRHTCVISAWTFGLPSIILIYSQIYESKMKSIVVRTCRTLYCHQCYSLIKLEFIGQTFVRSNRQAESELVLICAQCLVYQKFLSYHSYHYDRDYIYFSYLFKLMYNEANRLKVLYYCILEPVNHIYQSKRVLKVALKQNKYIFIIDLYL